VSVAGVALGSPEGAPLPRVLVGVLALGATAAGLVALALVFAGPSTYEDIARANSFDRATFHVPGTASVRQAVRYDVRTLVALHTGTLAYVLGDVPGTPRDPTTRDPLYSADEQRHLADVRELFAAARVTAVLGLLAAVLVLAKAARRRPGVYDITAPVALRALRDAALVAGLLVVTIGAVGAIAFGPAFLAFHYIFFPQGNFLFDPASSNLLGLYPEAYWYAVTLRVALSFVVAAAAVTGVAHLALRRRAAR
jgi:integral membrane protein (TIGR01906 family)